MIVHSAIVGGLGDVVTDLNEEAYEKLQFKKHLAIVKGATHLFEEPGTLQEVGFPCSDLLKPRRWRQRIDRRSQPAAPPAHQPLLFGTGESGRTLRVRLGNSS